MKALAITLGLALLIGASAMAAHKVAVLDGTSWKIEAEPDDMAQEKGAEQIRDDLVFAEGKASLKVAGKNGFAAGPYSVTNVDEEKKQMTFKAEMTSATEGAQVWTGTVHGGDHMEGKMVWTKANGNVLTYTFEGDKLD